MHISPRTIKKFFDRAALSLVIASVVFSNIPYHILSGVIEGYIHTANIVDKSWRLSQNSNVVDKFTSYRNLAEGMKIHEAHAAITYGANGAVAYSALNGGTVSPAYPAGIAAGDLLVLIIGMKPSAANGGSVTTPAGWTPIVSLTGAGGYGTTLGADTGNTNVFSFSKTAVGTETGTLAVTLATNNISWAQMYRLRGGAGTTWSVVGATGADTTAGAAVSVAMTTNPGVTAGDFIIGAMVIPTNVTTPAQFSAENLTQTGVTFGARTEIIEPDTALGSDLGGVTYRAPVSAGTGTGNPTFTATAGGTTTNVRGPGIFIRVREVPSAPTTSISNFVTAEPGNSTIAPGATNGYVDSFGLATNTGTDTVTGATVTLAAGTGARVATVAITNDADTVTYCSAAPVGDSATLTGCGIPVTSTNAQFKIRIAANSHASMPAPPGANYAVTGTVTAFTSTNPQAGSDTGSSTLMIDNLSPGNVTVASGGTGDGSVTLSWTNPGDADYQSAVVLRRMGTPVADAPVEGATYVVGNTIGTAMVACVVAAPAATCNDTGLTNGTQYHYEIFTKDTNGNYDVGVIPTGSPFTPAVPLTAFVGAAHADVSALSLTVNKPAGTLDGDIMFALVTHRLNEAPSVVPAGWNLIGTNVVVSASTHHTNLYWKLAAAEGASYVWSWPTSARAFATIVTYRGGFDPANPIAVVSNTLYTTADTIVRAASMNVPTANSPILHFGWIHVNPLTGAETLTPPTIPALFTEDVDYQETVILRYKRAVSRLDGWAGSGATGNMDALSSPATGDKHAFAVALKPLPTITVTGYTNTTEPALDYAAACTTCGARIGGGAGFRQSITISGSGFGADPGAGSRSTGSDNVTIGTHRIADANITAWSPTSITFLTDSAVVGDTDTDWGTEFGGASALTVTAGGTTALGVNFYVFPQITSVSQPAGLAADTAREYDAGDLDGIVTLNGTRFGGSQGTGSVTIVGQTGTVNTWGNTAIEVQVPGAIPDTTNTGSVAMTQGAGANGETATYANTLRILPRITGFTPTSASEGGAVTVNGNHFCQGVSCPGSFSATNKVTFTSAVDAAAFTSWSATAIATAVPVGAVTGNVIVTSNAYESNGKSFTVLSNTPAPPTSLNQWKNVGLTQGIPVGGAASGTPIYLTMIIEVPSISGGTLYPQIEYKPIGTPFACGAGVCAGAVEGTGNPGPGPVDCGLTANTCAISITPTDDVYHWQARVRHNKGGTDYFSGWTSFDSVNPETSIDFQIDTTPPTITNVSSGAPGSNTATITWNTASEGATTQLQYNTTGTFGVCAGDCTALDPALLNAHSVSLSNLNSGTIYYYRVRSRDAAGNETVSSNYTFTTSSVSTPAKTVKAYISGATGQVVGATPYQFTVDAPETVPNVQNAYIEVFGVVSGGVGTITVQANSAPARVYAVSATIPTFYRFLYPIASPNTETNLNLNDSAPCSNGALSGLPPSPAPPCNLVTLTPATVSMYVLSAKIITTYSYTP